MTGASRPRSTFRSYPAVVAPRPTGGAGVGGGAEAAQLLGTVGELAGLGLLAPADLAPLTGGGASQAAPAVLAPVVGPGGGDDATIARTRTVRDRQRRRVRPNGPRRPGPRRRPNSSPWGRVPRLWLVEADAAGTTKIGVKMADAVARAKLLDPGQVDWALGHAAVHARVAEADLGSILDHHARTRRGPTHQGDETRSLTQGTAGWAALGRQPQDQPQGPVAS